MLWRERVAPQPPQQLLRRQLKRHLTVTVCLEVSSNHISFKPHYSCRLLKPHHSSRLLLYFLFLDAPCLGASTSAASTNAAAAALAAEAATKQQLEALQMQMLMQQTLLQQSLLGFNPYALAGSTSSASSANAKVSLISSFSSHFSFLYFRKGHLTFHVVSVFSLGCI